MGPRYPIFHHFRNVECFSTPLKLYNTICNRFFTVTLRDFILKFHREQSTTRRESDFSSELRPIPTKFSGKTNGGTAKRRPEYVRVNCISFSTALHTESFVTSAAVSNKTARAVIKYKLFCERREKIACDRERQIAL